MASISKGKNRLIESEVTQNKEQLFNCTKCQKTDRSKDILN